MSQLRLSLIVLAALAGCNEAEPSGGPADEAEIAADAGAPPPPVAASAESATPALPAELANVTLADPGPGLPPGTALRFEPLESKFAPGDVQLINGQTIDRSAFPATVISTANGFSCTATLIGPRVVLTAAHCIDDQRQPAQVATAAVRFRPNTAPIPMQCTMHPVYATAAYVGRGLRSSKDWALCELAAAPSGVVAETLSLAPLTANAPIFMLGYGCTQIVRNARGELEGVAGSNVGTALLAGVDNVTWTGLRMPGEPSPGVHVVTRASGAEPSLCPGDSGGGSMTGVTMAALANAQTAATARRRIAAINSGVGADPGRTAPLYSYFSPLGTAPFRQFLDQWSRKAADAAAAAQRPVAPERRVCLDDATMQGHLAPGASTCRA